MAGPKPSIHPLIAHSSSAESAYRSEFMRVSVTGDAAAELLFARGTGWPGTGQRRAGPRWRLREHGGLGGAGGQAGQLTRTAVIVW